jgi:hypothetical protein
MNDLLLHEYPIALALVKLCINWRKLCYYDKSAKFLSVGYLHRSCSLPRYRFELCDFNLCKVIFQRENTFLRTNFPKELVLIHALFLGKKVKLALSLSDINAHN